MTCFREVDLLKSFKYLPWIKIAYPGNTDSAKVSEGFRNSLIPQYGQDLRGRKNTTPSSQILVVCLGILFSVFKYKYQQDCHNQQI